MSRAFRVMLLIVVLLFMLACNAVSQPIKDVQNVADTAESLATSMPDMASTIEAAATSMPDLAATVEVAGTDLPDIGQMFDPQGEPVSEWNGIPVMPQATAGQEFVDADSYSFKTSVAVEDVQTFYNDELPKLGWTSAFSIPGSAEGAVMLFSKESNSLTITITVTDGMTVVVLTYL